MYKLRKFAEKAVLKDLCYSLLYSHFVYGVEVWGSACRTAIKPLVILQKKAVRLMTFNDQFPETPGPLCPTDPLFLELELLKIQDIFTLQASKFIFRCLSHESPQIFWDWFTYSSSIHNYNTTSTSMITTNSYFDVGVEHRDNPTLHTRNSRLVNYGGKSLKVAGPFLWNSIPLPIL